MAFPFLALALLLAQADPAATPASAPSEALSTGPGGPAMRADAYGDLIPAGSPDDDFGAVAWCHGVLSGHMALAQQVKDVLPVDPLQEQIGRAYIKGYETALAGAKDGETEAGRARAQAAHDVGWNNWDAARKADPKLAADTYLAWQLPARCEHAAVRLSGNKALFADAPSEDSVAAASDSTYGGGAKPKKKSKH